MMFWQPFFLALANRCRGGLIYIKQGQLGRLLFWAFPLAFTIYMGGHFDSLKDNCFYVLYLILAAFGGSCWAAWGPYVNLTQPTDFKNLTIEGLKFVGPAALVACGSSVWLGLSILLSGLCIAPCYWMGWRIPSTIKGLERGTPIGETLFGFFIGFFIYLKGVILV